MPLSVSSQRIFSKCSEYSESSLAAMRSKASDIFDNNDSILVGINGSYARREATLGSDADLFFLYTGDNESQAQDLQIRFHDELESMGYRKPSAGGVFSVPLSVGSICNIIGGLDDTNIQTTQRMLLLLEGDWIYNESLFNKTFENLLSKYVPPTVQDKHICIYLLNDIIRYWRTICVDYEYKIGAMNKPRNLRFIKLRFSRKLLYFAGVLAVSFTQGLSPQEKINELKNLLSMPPIERLKHLVDEDSVPALDLYAEFLASLDDESTRNSLDDSESEEFGSLRAKARDFNKEIEDLLYKYCGGKNPTLSALIL